MQLNIKIYHFIKMSEGKKGMILIMKDIKIVKLDKYNSENYKEIAFSVYFNKKANNYCFAFEADEVNQYPLEDLLDQYNVSCTEYYGQKVTINNEEKKYC